VEFIVVKKIKNGGFFAAHKNIIKTLNIEVA